MAATAADADGTVARVEFYAGDEKLGEDAGAPYSFTWANAPVGPHQLTAVAEDEDGARSTSSAVTITVEPPNQAPTVALTAPAADALFVTPADVALAATAADADGTVARVEFYAGPVKLGQDEEAPYTHLWVDAPPGAHDLTAVAVDEDGAATVSPSVAVTVVPPLTIASVSPGSGEGTEVVVSTVVVAVEAATVDFEVVVTGGTQPYEFVWSVDGAATESVGPHFAYTPGHSVAGHRDQAVDQTVRCVVTDANGLGPVSATWKTVRVTDVDQHAPAPIVGVWPATAEARKALVATVIQQEADPDGDDILGHDVVWELLGTRTTVAGFLLSGDMTRPGQPWRVTVRARTRPDTADVLSPLAGTAVVTITAAQDGDADGDGLQDVWEDGAFGDLRFGAEDDPDGDGLTNAEEETAGSDPAGYDIELFAGWNLVSLPGNVEPRTVAAVFGTGPASPLRGPVWAWDPLQRAFQRAEILGPFWAYWVYSSRRETVKVHTSASDRGRGR